MSVSVRRLLRNGIATVALAAALVLVATAAEATHWRYGHITWAPDPGEPSGLKVNFHVQNGWRRDAFTTANGRCIDATQNPPVSIACTGPGGAAGVGDVIHERQAADESTLDPGDGSPPIGSPVPIGGSNSLLYLVTSIDAANNWLFGEALDPATFPVPAGCGGGNIPSTCDTVIEHTYATPGSYVAELRDCCRIEACVAPNAHINNPENGYRARAVVEVGAGANSSPVSTLPPIILCPVDALCMFEVPVSDNEGDGVTFRLATDSEADFDVIGGSTGVGLGQPGQSAGCTDPTNGNAGIDPLTGVYAWNTTDCRLAGDPLGPPPTGGCGNPALATLYSTQVVVEEQGSGVSVPLDFLIQLSPCPFPNNTPPAFDSPPSPLCGTALSATPNNPVNLTIQASDVDLVDVVELNVAGLPTGAMMTAGLPISGNPVSSAFSWTPTASQKGQHVVTFTAVDACTTALCSITIDVSDEICDNGIDDDGDALADCADPDCNATPCDDGDACTENDQCTGGVCAGSTIDCSSLDALCIAGTCNPTTGICEPQPLGDGTPCDDGDACTAPDTCTSGSCGGPVAPDSTPCDDDDPCTEIDVCTAGSCAGSPKDCSGAGGQCSEGSCNPTTGMCEATPLGDGEPCDLDTDLCSIDECVSGSCTNVGVLPPDSCQQGVPIFGCEGIPAARIFPQFARPALFKDTPKVPDPGFDRWGLRGEFVVGDATFDPDSQSVVLTLNQEQINYQATLGPGNFVEKGSPQRPRYLFRLRRAAPSVPGAEGWRKGKFALTQPGPVGQANRVRYLQKGDGVAFTIDGDFLLDANGDTRLRETIRVGDTCYTAVTTCRMRNERLVKCFSLQASGIPQ